MSQKPSLGRIVLVPRHPTRNNGSGVAPAVITRVWSDAEINARVLPDTGSTEVLTSLTYVEEIGENTHATDRAHVWTWPPRV